jgi:hypothetical protein
LVDGIDPNVSLLVEFKFVFGVLVDFTATPMLPPLILETAVASAEHIALLEVELLEGPAAVVGVDADPV